MHKAFVIVVIAFLLITGCTTQIPRQEQTLTVSPTKTITETPTLPHTTPGATPLSEKTYKDYEIKLHFLDIAFGRDTYFLVKFYPSSSNRVAFSLYGHNTADDEQFMTNFAKNYNNFTETVTFHDPPVRTDDKGAYLGFFSSSYLKSIDESQIIYRETDPSNGDYLFIITSIPGEFTHYYVNSDLTGDRRNHYIMRAMLYYIGFRGVTNTYPESFFYTENRNGAALISLDKSAINVMYNKRINAEMSRSAVMDILFPPHIVDFQ